MPLNMTHPVVKAEKQPPPVVALGARLAAQYGTPATSFGIKGDSTHLTGYHRSFNTLTQVPGAGGWGDYSIQSPLDNTNLDRDDNSAADYTPAPWGTALCRQRMIEHTSRMYEACRARDSRVRQVREFAGTFDGKTVVRFRNDGSFSSPFDSSHRWHWHLSFYRSRVRWDHSGIADILIGSTKKGRKMFYLVSEKSGEVWFADKMVRRVIVSAADLADIRFQATGGMAGMVAGNGTIFNIPAGTLDCWGVNLNAGAPVELTEAQLAEIADAAREGAEAGSGGATVDEIREVVDSELDEAFRGAADTDPTG